jgi:Zn-dependent protease
MQEAIAGLLPFIVGGSAILISITIHEFSHGLAAYLQGDMTARDAGRLTLNPIAHLDLFGSLILPGILILSKAPFLIGWAKPVPFDPRNLSNVRFGSLFVGLAGPLSNTLLAIASALLLRMVYPILGSENFLIAFLAQLVLINVVLAVFNLIPLAPLDGSKILFGLLPPRYEHVSNTLEIYGPYILLALLFIEFSVYPILGRLIDFVLGLVTNLLGLSGL